MNSTDSYSFIDSIQLEKANALARYRRFNRISKFLKIIEVLFAAAFIAWSSTHIPTVFKLSVDYLYAWSKQHVVFLLGNLIVVVCYVLSGHTRNESAGVEILEDNSYKYTSHFNSYIHTNQQKASEVDSVIELVKPLVEELPEVKQTAILDEVHEKVNRDENANVKTETVIKQATKEMERFQRTQSVKLRREIAVKPCRELRRSVTERRSPRRGVEIAGDGYSMVESLSDEEFRLAVEGFILKQQRLLKQQTMVEE